EGALGHEAYQNGLKTLKKRQSLFQEEGVVNLVVDCLDRLHLYYSAANVSESVGGGGAPAEDWESLLNSFYQLLASLIRGNRRSCAQFSSSLDWLVERLDRTEASTGVLEVLHCMLLESPEALNVIKEGHIQSIIALLDKHGRNHKPGGYRPAPLDLSHMALCSALEVAVVALAENEHNTWAKELIRQGWTYGAQQDLKAKRSPQLVPYSLLEEQSRGAGRDSSREAVCTLLAYGYSLEPLDLEPTALTEPCGVLPCAERCHVFRTDQCYAVTQGRWYFEFEALTAGDMRVGWARPGCSPDRELGSDHLAY
ncbi:hypothetical protein CRUP_036699, partial [Coryphaenoides rupestris]